MTTAASTTPQAALGTADSRAKMFHYIILAILVGVATSATWPVWAAVFSHAYLREEQGHSLLALPLAAWLVWVRRVRLRGLSPRWAVEGPVVMAAGWMLASAGFRSGTDVALHLGSLMVVLGAAYTALGRRFSLRLLPAVGALVLVLPVPGRMRLAIAGPLQEWSAQITEFALDFVAVPVQRSGNVLTINGVDVAIAEACNGMRMVSALAVISYAFVFSVSLRPTVRLAILAMSPLLALAVNVLRLIPTALLFGYARRETAELFHDVSGWGGLALAIGMLIGIVAVLKWLEVPVDNTTARCRAVQGTDNAANRVQSRPVRRVAPAAAVLVLGGIFMLGGFDARRTPGVDAYLEDVRAMVAATPYRIGTAVGMDQPVSPGATRILQPNAILQRRYADPLTGSGFGLMVIHCGDVRDLLDHYPPVCYPAHGWTACGMQSRAFGAGTAAVTARVYDFKRLTEAGQSGARVVSFFVLPRAEGSVVDDMEAVALASRSTTTTALGAAHVMVSFAGKVGEADIADVMAQVLELLEPTIRTMARGIRRE